MLSTLRAVTRRVAQCDTCAVVSRLGAVAVAALRRHTALLDNSSSASSSPVAQAVCLSPAAVGAASPAGVLTDMPASPDDSVRLDAPPLDFDNMHRVLPVCALDGKPADAVRGVVRWSPAKSLFIGSMNLATLIVGPLTLGVDTALLFAGTTSACLLFGHSIGMHRRLIHSSFDCPRWLEYTCVYLGTLVGMAGPYGIVRTHDTRDWAQRQRQCHPYLRHGTGMLRDAWWQMHCDLHLARPPQFHLERRLADSGFYRWLDRTWMWQQVPWALLLFALGGWGWVVWGVCARVTAGVGGHWWVGHLAHRRGHRRYHVRHAAAQGYNVPGPARVLGLLSFGECWHNNHHAFPGSARLGLFKGEWDPGYAVLRLWQRWGWVRRVRLPQHLPSRPELETL